jgi:CubicO group peptidase (beta-lactamase class C family)
MVRRNSFLAGMCAIALFVISCNANPATVVSPPNYWPTDGWQTDSPENHGFDQKKLSEIGRNIPKDLPFLDSLIIIRNGYIVYESYHNGYGQNQLHDIASVTKSWTSALVGVAQKQGKITSLDEPLSSLLPEYFTENKFADKREITLRQLLMMRSGIDFSEDVLNSGGYGGEELLAGDLTAFGLEFPMAYTPGETWNYSTLDTQLISAIMKRATGESLESYAVSNLFEPMGIENYAWMEDGMGTTIAGQNLSMAPRDMAKLGLLYLHGGNWDGNQLVPADWVKLSLTPQGDAYYPPTEKVEKIEWYGYQWWTWKSDWFFGYRAFEARGYGGQWVTVFPELDMILVTNANLNVEPVTGELEQYNAIGALYTDGIFPALTDVELKK